MQPVLRVKGFMARTPAEQVALAVRILDGRHAEDVYARGKKAMGNRIGRLGPLDLTRNTLSSAVDRINKIHRPPPLVDGLDERLAALMGDQSARVTVDRYLRAGGRPMPTSQVRASAKATRYRLGAGYAGVLLGVVPRTQGMYFDVIRPDDLELEYASDDPTEPTVIRHHRRRKLGREVVECVDVYDLTDLDAPSFRVVRGREDITAQVLTEDERGDYFWRLPDGQPFHRIVITGDPHDPYRTNSLVEMTLSVCTLLTHWSAGIVDAGHPRTHSVGLDLESMDSATGETGTETGPEIAFRWRHQDPERPGTLIQHGPGFDPKITGEAIRGHEMASMSALGIPVDHASTGGEPTETEQRELREVIADQYAECRRMDSEILRRSAAIMSLVTGEEFDTTPYGVLYREEVAEALGAVQAADEAAEEQSNGGAGTGGRGRPRGEVAEGAGSDAA